MASRQKDQRRKIVLPCKPRFPRRTDGHLVQVAKAHDAVLATLDRKNSYRACHPASHLRTRPRRQTVSNSAKVRDSCQRCPYSKNFNRSLSSRNYGPAPVPACRYLIQRPCKLNSWCPRHPPFSPKVRSRTARIPLPDKLWAYPTKIKKITEA
jgi:hypothetical protein